MEKHLEQLNEQYGHIVDNELVAFENKCKFICNLIKSEFSGRNGEEKAFRSLDVIYGKKHIIKNCEMEEADERTELDAVVVTPKGIFIVEVKNTGKDILIDEKGDYYRTGAYLNWDSNIGEKMNVRQKLLRRALEKANFDKEIKIQNIVVFTTNNRIEVINRYEYIKTCFFSSLPHVINNFKGYSIYSDEDMEAIVAAIENARCEGAYSVEMDMAQFKVDFAKLVATLEDAAVKVDEKIPKKVVDVISAKAEENYEIKISKKELRKIAVATGFSTMLISGLMVTKRISKRI